MQDRPDPGAADAASPAEEATPDAGPAQAGADVLAALDTARTEAAREREQHLRARAEAENVRRRAETEMAAVRKYAIEGFASEILRVLDSLELARGANIDPGNPEAVTRMLEGLDLTLRQMGEVLRRFHIEVVDPRPGERFDPDSHQAMSVQDSADVPPNHVVAVVQRGYRLHDRLLRPAMVIVARAAPQA